MTDQERITRLENLFKTIEAEIHKAFEVVSDTTPPSVLTLKSVENA